jgi:hypothetical protein
VIKHGAVSRSLGWEALKCVPFTLDLIAVQRAVYYGHVYPEIPTENSEFFHHPALWINIIVSEFGCAKRHTDI